MKVMLAIPSYRGLECLPFVDSLRNTVSLLEGRGISCELLIVYGHSYVQAARNDIVHRFLESDCDRLVFLDEDISWTGDAVIALLESDKPITAAVYPQKTEDVSDFPMPVVPICNADGVPLVDGPYLRATRAMTGFMCIQREVFAILREAFPELAFGVYAKSGEVLHMFDYFPQGVHDGTWLGEDFAFCRLWEKTGGEIAVLTDFTFGHHRKGKSWYGNLAQFIRQLPGGVDYENKNALKAVWCVDHEEGVVWRN